MKTTMTMAAAIVTKTMIIAAAMKSIMATINDSTVYNSINTTDSSCDTSRSSYTFVRLFIYSTTAYSEFFLLPCLFLDLLVDRWLGIDCFVCQRQCIRLYVVVVVSPAHKARPHINLTLQQKTC
jgi:hypothetical protein